MVIGVSRSRDLLEWLHPDEAAFPGGVSALSTTLGDHPYPRAYNIGVSPS